MRGREVYKSVVDTHTGRVQGSTLKLGCIVVVILSSVLSMPFLDSSLSCASAEAPVYAAPFCTDSTP